MDRVRELHHSDVNHTTNRMREYNERNYRLSCGSRWNTFTVKHKEIDLWIGVTGVTELIPLIQYAQTLIEQQRQVIDHYIQLDPDFLKALLPYSVKDNAPFLVKKMEEASRQAGIGPMSAVAGTFAQFIGEELMRRFPIEEVIVENGGDIYADSREDLDIALFAGESPLSQKVGLKIPASYTPCGICTSAGTVGPSLSFGKADAVMIVCKSTPLADSFATAFANKVQTEEDVSTTITAIQDHHQIDGAMVVKGKQLGISGKFELQLFK